MNQLTEAQFDVCQQYLSMLDCIEEGFTYIIASFKDFSKTESELVLSDILEALTSIANANTLLSRLLVEDESIQKAILSFEDVTEAATALYGQFNQYNMKTRIINDLFYPAFATWRDIVQNALTKYVVQ